MYPPQTSLIPVQVALAKFLEVHGLQAVLTDYPYWYLGTTPFRYLTGPILPSLLVGLHRIFPYLSLFTIHYSLFTIFWLIGGVGVYLLIREMRGNEGLGGLMRADLVALTLAFFYLFGPIVPFLFRFSDGLYLMAFSFLPYVLLLYLRFLRQKTKKVSILLVIAISFLILLDTLILSTLFLGMAAILLATTGWKQAEEKIKNSLVFLFFSFLVATLWYTPSYWWTLLGAPSFGGKGLGQVIVWLGKLLPVALAFTFAIISVKFFKKRNILRDFCFYWLFIFGFLTLIRFLSDPDFWLDWSAYGTELQLGVAIALGGWLGGQLEDRRQRAEDGLQKTEDGRQIIENQSSIFSLQNLFSVFHFPSSILLVFYLILFTFVFNKYVLETMQQDVTNTVEYRIGRQLSEITKSGERIFLSGTTAFWLNAFFDIPQVRGGRDQASVDQRWRAAVWEIREGRNAEDAEKWLRTLNVSYLVVHSSTSSEYYHDFVYPEKFETARSLRRVFSDKGDIIYQVLD